jgi:hypothetical protein
LQDLKAMIEQKTIHSIGFDPAADPVRGFKKKKRDAIFIQLAGAAQPCKPCTDDNNG